MPNRQVYIHIGLHKTGTSSIQESLFADQNNNILRNEGYLYPKLIPRNHSISFYSMFCDEPVHYHMNMKRSLSEEEVEKVNQQYKENFTQELMDDVWSNLVISGEDISLLNENNLLTLKEYTSSLFNDDKLEFHIILSVREPVSWLMSKVQEEIKNGDYYERIINDYLGRFEGLFERRITPFINVFGKEQMKVSKFEDAVKCEEGLVGHFLQQIDVHHETRNKITEVRANESITSMSADLISFINRNEPLIVNNRLNPNRKPLDFLPLSKIASKKYDLPPEIKKVMIAKAERDIHFLRDQFAIDYSETSYILEDHHWHITEKSIEDIKNGYAASSPLLREWIQRYFGEISHHVDLNTKEVFEHLVQEMKDGKLDQYGMTPYEKRFINTLGIDQNMELADIYREVALFLEGHHEIDSAKYMMGKALKLRPNGPFIKKKFNEYSANYLIEG